MAFEIVGREKELATVHGFIDEPAEVAAVLVLEGEAGIGKSTLWLAAVGHARERGLRVLSARPAEAERGLAHVGLGDLFEGILDEVLPALRAPRRRALEVALLREDQSGEPVDSRALAVAVRDALHELATNRRVLVAIDDVQWLDPSSSTTLAFALRRLLDSDLRLLLARRLADGVEPSELERAVKETRVPVGPLTAGAVHRFLRDRLGRSFGRQTLLRIHERSGGNPFFALEIARALPDEIDPVRPLPVPETLDELVRARLARLPESTRQALALVSALGTPSESLLDRAGVSGDELETAVAAQVVEREQGAIRFTHPLLASALYGSLGTERRNVHARIAEIVPDPLAQARHRALATQPPDPVVAKMLDDAAAFAADRGLAAVAAELAEHALRLTPPELREEHHRRTLIAARAHRSAGEWSRAKTLTTKLVTEAESGRMRAEALVLLSEPEFVTAERSVSLLQRALRDAAREPALQSLIQARLASATWGTDPLKAREHGRTALELAERLDDDALRAGALAILGQLGALTGDAEALTLVTRSYELAHMIGDPRLRQDALGALADALLARRSIDAARHMLEREYHEWVDRDELYMVDILWWLSWVELWGGRWELAADYATRARDLGIQNGLELPVHHLPIGVVAVHRGDLDSARMHADRMLELRPQELASRAGLAVVEGLVAHASADSIRATEWFAQANRHAKALGFNEPTVCWWNDDYVEALLEVRRIDDAKHTLDAWDADAVTLGRRWVIAQVMRCRGLVAAAEGDVAEGMSLLERAVTEHGVVSDTFGRARALLALGVVRRRARQKRAARDAIEQALAGFRELEALIWVDKAQSELFRIGGRTRQEGLTPAERRVAVLVAEGRTNSEVAAALFLGERTVASHLTRIYAKLGVRSRTELARKVQTF